MAKITARRRARRPLRTVLVATALAVAGSLTLAPTGPAAADGPGVGTPTVVALGDSFISGEAGRWAGNTNLSPSRIDALGPTAYYDNASGTGEEIRGCHRSRSAEIHIGGGVDSVNLACSGAQTRTFTNGEFFKPGLDFYDDGAGHRGQALMLQDLAASKNVRMVVVSIGGNDFGFGPIVEACITNFATSTVLAPNYCNDDPAVTAQFTAANVAARRADIAQALRNVDQAMTQAGYTAGTWSLVVQTYPAPLADSDTYRYSQVGLTRQAVGGCGFWDADADWAHDVALSTINGAVTGAVADSGLTGVRVLTLTRAFEGRRLCEDRVGLLEERGLSSWRSKGAVDKTEWVHQIRTVTTLVPPYEAVEGLHPNYWGQLALRSCVRQVYNDGAPRSGTCLRGKNGLTALGEPRMRLS